MPTFASEGVELAKHADVNVPYRFTVNSNQAVSFVFVKKKNRSIRYRSLSMNIALPIA